MGSGRRRRRRENVDAFDLSQAHTAMPVPFESGATEAAERGS
jgi:hypothetical protein